MFEPFQNMVKKAAGHYGVAREVEAAQICEICRKVLKELIGEGMESFVRPGYFRDGVLMINANDAAWLQEIMIKREKILAAVNEKYGREMVKSVQMRIFS